MVQNSEVSRVKFLTAAEVSRLASSFLIIDQAYKVLFKVAIYNMDDGGVLFTENILRKVLNPEKYKLRPDRGDNYSLSWWLTLLNL